MSPSATAFVALEIAGAAAVAFRVFFRCRQEVSFSVRSPELGNVIGYGYRAGCLRAVSAFVPAILLQCRNCRRLRRQYRPFGDGIEQPEPQNFT